MPSSLAAYGGEPTIKSGLVPASRIAAYGGEHTIKSGLVPAPQDVGHHTIKSGLVPAPQDVGHHTLVELSGHSFFRRFGCRSPKMESTTHEVCTPFFSGK